MNFTEDDFIEGNNYNFYSENINSE